MRIINHKYISIALAAFLSAQVFSVSAHTASPENAGGGLYLVESQDPGFLETLAGFSSVEYDRGRTRLVKLTVPYDSLPDEIRAKLRPVSPYEVYNAPAVLSQKESILPEVLTLVSKVSADRIKASATAIAMTGKRSAAQLDVTSGSGNKRTMDLVADTLKGLGYAVERHCYKDRKMDKECNIAGYRPGPGTDPKTVLVAAHLDSVGYDNAGADDNASGTAGLLEMARVLAGYRSDHALLFVATNGEENGIVGAYAYAKKLQASGGMGNLAWAINMDMIAWNRDGVVEIETNKEFIAHADWVGTMAKLYTRLQPHVASPAWGSDHVPFLEAGVPTYLSIEHWEDHNPCYHKSCDKPEGLNWNFAADIVKLNLAVIAGKTRLEPARD
ncbi:MAG: hypothetical protein A3J79_08185 [Elusimicrobia bacterium RIFOXYB2_FULL_62_6]|nr:MAG: hypothetical protein A3J79_08185 [Elusimicrobia bacterium RIFOXYB2_FULL_62_6]